MSDGDSDEGFVFIERDLIGRTRPKHPSTESILVKPKSGGGDNDVVSKKMLVLRAVDHGDTSQPLVANQFNLVYDTQSEMAGKKSLVGGENEEEKIDMVTALGLDPTNQRSTTPPVKKIMEGKSIPEEKPARVNSGTGDNQLVVTEEPKNVEEKRGTSSESDDEEAEYMRRVEEHHKKELERLKVEKALKEAAYEWGSSSSSHSSSRRSSVRSSEADLIHSEDESAPVAPEAPVQVANVVEASELDSQEDRVKNLTNLCVAALKSGQRQPIEKQSKEEYEAARKEFGGIDLSAYPLDEFEKRPGENCREEVASDEKKEEEFGEEEEEGQREDEDDDEYYMRRVNGWHKQVLLKLNEFNETAERVYKNAVAFEKDEPIKKSVAAPRSEAEKAKQEKALKGALTQLFGRSSDYNRSERYVQPSWEGMLEESEDKVCDKNHGNDLEYCDKKEVEMLRKEYHNASSKGHNYVMNVADRKEVERLRKEISFKPIVLNSTNPANDASEVPVEMMGKLNLEESKKVENPAVGTVLSQNQYAVKNPDGKVHKIRVEGKPTPKPFAAETPQLQPKVSNQYASSMKTPASNPAVEPKEQKPEWYARGTPGTNIVHHPEFVGHYTSEEYARKYVKSDKPREFFCVPGPRPETSVDPLAVRQDQFGVYRPLDHFLEAAKPQVTQSQQTAHAVLSPSRSNKVTQEKPQVPATNYYAPPNNQHGGYGYAPPAPLAQDAYARPFQPVYSNNYQQQVMPPPSAPVARQETPEEAEARRAEENCKSEEFIALMGLAVVEHDAMIHLLNAGNNRRAEQRRLDELGLANKGLTEREIDDILEGKVKPKTQDNQGYNPNAYPVAAYPVPVFPVPVYPNQTPIQQYPVNVPQQVPTGGYNQPPYSPAQVPLQTTYPIAAYPGPFHYMEYGRQYDYQQQQPSSSNYQQQPSGSNYQHQPPYGQQYPDAGQGYSNQYPSESQSNYYQQPNTCQAPWAQPEPYVPPNFYPVVPQQTSYQPTTRVSNYDSYTQPAYHSQYRSRSKESYKGFLKSRADNYNGYNTQQYSRQYQTPQMKPSHLNPGVFIDEYVTDDDIKNQIIKFITEYNKQGRTVYLSTFFDYPSQVPYTFDFVAFVRSHMSDILTVQSILTPDVQTGYVFEFRK